MIQKPIKMEINRAMVICLRHGIKVYPDVNGRHFNVVVDDNGAITRYNKLVGSNDINAALAKTYKAWAIQVIKNQDKENAKVTK